MVNAAMAMMIGAYYFCIEVVVAVAVAVASSSLHCHLRRRISIDSEQARCLLQLLALHLPTRPPGANVPPATMVLQRFGSICMVSLLGE